MHEIIETGAALVASTCVKECVKKIVDTYIKPKMEIRYQELESNKKVYLIQEKLDEYFENTYRNNIYMSTIVFKNQQKTINDLYIPLTVSKCFSKENNIPICINSYRDDFIPAYKKVLLVDNAGMGKSTLLKYLYLSSITENKGIPILIELRRLSKGTTIIDFIVNEINGIEQYLTKEDILKLIQGGGFIFFFDGYDEITDENKKDVTEGLQYFISKTSLVKGENNNFIISSRDESSLSCFSDFQRFDIKPLSKDEAYNLISKYDNDGELSKELIEKLKSEENLSIIDEFLVNPLMVSLLYKAFEYKRTIPYKKQIFYRQVYDALFEDHDRSKGGAYVHPKKCKLDIEDFHRVLRALGCVTLSKGVSYSKEELMDKLSKAKKITAGIEFKEESFIEDITHAVPLFVKEGIQYRWAHKSFQEYFAASYICYDAKEKQCEYLTKMIESENASKYYNVLDFCYDIDFDGFRKDIIYPIIREFVNYYEDSYKDKRFRNIDKKSINVRKNINFIYEEVYINFVNSIDDEDVADSFERAFENWKNSKLRISSRVISGREGKNVTIASGFLKTNKNINALLRLFASKKLVIVEAFKNESFVWDIWHDIEKFGLKEYILDKENECVLIGKNEIDVINHFVMGLKSDMDGKNNWYLFNYNECVKLINTIESEFNFREDIFL